MTIWKAILIGQLVINVPAVAIMIAVMFLGSTVAPWPLALLAGSLLAWIWWSLIVPRWRDWVLGQGIDPNRLQKFAVRTGLTWPNRSIFEKTEFRRKK